jgi:hypothetical protein
MPKGQRAMRFDEPRAAVCCSTVTSSPVSHIRIDSSISATGVGGSANTVRRNPRCGPAKRSSVATTSWAA